MSKKWKRYRFKTYSVKDYRPLKINEQKLVWWCTGTAGDNSYKTIVAYLDSKENLLEYWDDAEDIDFTEHDKIEFSSRFPKPDYFKE